MRAEAETGYVRGVTQTKPRTIVRERARLRPSWIRILALIFNLAAWAALIMLGRWAFARLR